MNKLQQLIHELCPNGVEWKKLKEVCSDIIVPMRDRPKVFDGTTPWCRIEDKEGQYFNTSLSGLAVSEEVIQEMNLKVFPIGTVICSCSASLGSYAINTQPLITNQTFIGLVCGDLIYNKYLLYYMETQTAYIKSQATTGTIPYVSRKKFEEMFIPVPPLAVQTEIAGILDKFSTLTAELQAELQARKSQYEYYRNQLLDQSNGNVEWKKFGEIGTFIRGNGLQKKDFTESGVGCIHYGQIYTYYGTFTDKVKSFVSVELAKKLQKVNKGDLVIANTGENIEDICKAVTWLGNDEIVTGGHSTIFKHNQNPKYIAYYFQTEMFAIQKRKYAKGTKVIEVSAKDIEKISIPLPPLEEQERIVTILDKFDTLTNSITEGLPKEIELRQKQYEYYRNKLLTFKAIS